MIKLFTLHKSTVMDDPGSYLRQTMDTCYNHSSVHSHKLSCALEISSGILALFGDRKKTYPSACLECFIFLLSNGARDVHLQICDPSEKKITCFEDVIISIDQE